MNDITTPVSVPEFSAVDESKLPRMPDIPRERYLNEEFFQLEMKHVFRKVWLLIGHNSEYEKAGSYHLLDLDLAPVVVVRGRDNKLRAFLNSCQHRGATVLKAKEGCVKVMSCQYHGWTYNLEGKLIGVTEEHTFPHLNTEDYRLPELRCELWGGFVFINVDNDAPPLLDWLTPRIVQRFSPVFDSPLRVVWRGAWDFNCNWKLPVDAFREAYHINTIHPKTVAQMIECVKATVELNHNGHGAIKVPYWPKQKMQAGEWDAIPMFSGLSMLPGANDRELLENVIEPNLFPNVSLAMQAVGFPVFSMWPVAVNKSRVNVMWIGVDWGDAPMAENWGPLIEGSKLVAEEDLSNLMSIQKSLEADPLRGIPLATKEMAIYQLHAEIDRLIGAENIPLHLRVPDLLKNFYI